MPFATLPSTVERAVRAAPEVRRVELEEFLRHAASLGYAVSDFHLDAHDAVSEFGREPGRVISVHRKQYGRDFAVPPNGGWVSVALQALRDGHFGKP